MASPSSPRKGRGKGWPRQAHPLQGWAPGPQHPPPWAAGVSSLQADAVRAGCPPHPLSHCMTPSCNDRPQGGVQGDKRPPWTRPTCPERTCPRDGDPHGPVPTPAGHRVVRGHHAEGKLRPMGGALRIATSQVNVRYVALLSSRIARRSCSQATPIHGR